MSGSPRRFPFGLSAILGGLLVVAGVAFLGYSVGVYLEILPGSKVSVPPPVAFEQTRPTPAPPATATTVPTAGPVATPTMRPAPTRQAVAVAPTARPATGAELAPPDPNLYATPQVPADSEDWPYLGNRPRPGAPVHLEIPAIDLKTEVIEGGIIMNKQGQPEWQTVPFVALHYRETALVGGRGNSVISGHVVTLAEGNVFRNLYKLAFGDSVKVETGDGRFTYLVEEVKLVPPNAIEVMAPSNSPVLTLITCGGDFDTRTRSFSDRLIVVGRLTEWERRES